jgi:hypothetical protein
MASLLERPLLWANDDFEIRHAKNNEEFHGLWWGFMQDLGWVCHRCTPEEVDIDHDPESRLV